MIRSDLVVFVSWVRLQERNFPLGSLVQSTRSSKEETYEEIKSMFFDLLSSNELHGLVEFRSIYFEFRSNCLLFPLPYI